MVSAAPAADHVLRILAVLAKHPEPIPAAAVASALGLPRSTAYRLLGVLVEHGYLAYLPEERRYGLGVASYELGSAYQRQAPLTRLARPLIRHLVDRTRHNAHLTVLEGRDVVYLIEERAAGRPVLITDVGVRLPALDTASGLALLARLPAAQVRALFPSSVAVRRTLTDVRNRGYATEDGTITPGLASVAQSVVDHTGHPTAAIAVTYASADVDARERDRLVAAVTASADQLSHRLGHRP